MKRRRDRIAGYFARLKERLLSDGIDLSAANGVSPVAVPALHEPRSSAGESENERAVLDVDTVDYRQIDSDWTIDRALRAHPQISNVFATYDLPSCDQCAVRFHETINEAAEAYEIDLHQFLTSLRTLDEPT